MRRRLLSCLLAAALCLSLAPTGIRAAEDSGAAVDVTAYSYEIRPILSPFCYYVYVKTDNPDPLSFRFLDRDSAYATQDSPAYFEVLRPRTFVDVQYEDEENYRVPGGYIFKTGDAPPDGGELVLQQKTDDPGSYKTVIAGDGSYSILEYTYADTAVTVSCPALMNRTDYLIEHYTDPGRTLFENLDAVQAALNEISIYPRPARDSDRPSPTPWPCLGSSAYYPEQSLNAHYEAMFYGAYMFLNSAYPFVLDSLAFPGAIGAVASRLEPSATVTQGDAHYQVDVEYGGTKKTYGGDGNGSNDPIYTKDLSVLFTFDGSGADYGTNGSLDLYREKLQSYDPIAAEDMAVYRDLIQGDTYKNTISAAGGTWIRIVLEGIISSSTTFGYVYSRNGRVYPLSDVWVDGRYVGEYERLSLGAKFSDHPNSDILVRNMTYTDYFGEVWTRDVLFQYDAAADNWNARSYYRGYGMELPSEFLLTRAQVEAMDPDRNSNCLPRSGLIYDGTAYPGTPFGQLSGSCGEHVSYRMDPESRTLYLTGYGPMEDAVSSILVPWSTYCDLIEHVEMDEGITTLSNLALYNCGNLKELDLPDSLEEIHYGALMRCSGLTELEIPEGVTMVSEEALQECTALETLTLPAGLRSMSNLSTCTALRQVSFGGDPLTWLSMNLSLPENAEVRYETMLASGRCGDNLTFTLDFDTGALTLRGSGAIPDYSMENKSVYDQEQSAYVNVPVSTAPWGIAADFITSVTLEEGITEVGDYAFAYLKKAETLTLPASLSAHGYSSFRDCDGITDVYFGGDEITWNNLVVPVPKEARVHCAATVATGSCGDSAEYAVDLNTGVLTISGSGRVNDYGVSYRTAEDPDTGESVRVYTCSAPWSQVSDRITKVVVSEGITHLGSYALACLDRVTEAEFPASLAGAGDGVLDGCTSLTSLHFGGDPIAWSDLEILLPERVGLTCDGTFSSGACGDSARYAMDFTTGILTISGTGSTYDYSSKARYVRDEVTGERYYLSRSTAPWGAVTDQITEVVVEDGITDLGDYTFSFLSASKEFRLPVSIKTFGSSCFYDCAADAVIRYAGNLLQWKALSFTPPSGMQVLCEDNILSGPCGDSAEYALDTNSGVLTIRGTGAMWNYEDLDDRPWDDFYRLVSSLVVTEGITAIGDSAFLYMDALEQVTLPRSLRQIGRYAFLIDGEIQDVYYGGTEAQWKSVTRGSGNDSLTGAVRFHYGTTLTAVPATPATCTEEGRRAHWQDAAGNLFLDEAGTRSARASDLTLPALGHSWGAWSMTLVPTEEAEGLETRTCTRCGETETRTVEKLEPGNPFLDVPATAYYHKSVLWAVENKITAGTSGYTFSPADPCTRAQIVTFLWRAAGSPEPETDENPFTDVPDTAYYSRAVRWAVETGITKGTSETSFSPTSPCTRAQAVSFLYRACGSPEPENGENPFTDVRAGAYYEKAVIWAMHSGVTAGTSATTFSPDQTCTRAQIVTFLYRDRNREG